MGGLTGWLLFIHKFNREGLNIDVTCWFIFLNMMKVKFNSIPLFFYHHHALSAVFLQAHYFWDTVFTQSMTWYLFSSVIIFYLDSLINNFHMVNPWTFTQDTLNNGGSKWIWPYWSLKLCPPVNDTTWFGHWVLRAMRPSGLYTLQQGRGLSHWVWGVAEFLSWD